MEQWRGVLVSPRPRKLLAPCPPHPSKLLGTWTSTYSLSCEALCRHFRCVSAGHFWTQWPYAPCLETAAGTARLSADSVITWASAWIAAGNAGQWECQGLKVPGGLEQEKIRKRGWVVSCALNWVVWKFVSCLKFTKLITVPFVGMEKKEVLVCCWIHTSRCVAFLHFQDSSSFSQPVAMTVPRAPSLY